MNFRTFLLCIILCICRLYTTDAQTPSDALMMKKSELCLAVIYQNDKWDEYWEGTLLRDNQNIGILTRNTVMPMVAYGLTEKLNFIATLPYVSTEASGGQMVGASGLQDFGIFAKYQVYELKKESGSFLSFVTAGFSLPASSYLSDYMPFSLGLGAEEFSLRGILKYEHKSGLYLRGSYAYMYRTTTEAERDYYYADKGIYTTTMDVPNATSGELALGGWLFGRALQLEVSGMNMTSLSGDDIRRQNQAQPTNKMNFTNGNARLRFFPSFLKGFSLMGGYSQVFEGRNIGKSTVISGGITYQFITKK
ncbi:MAG: transporter [Saprospiraceae bacterium]|nr:transporter [Saprospiraceae bacterium]